MPFDDDPDDDLAGSGPPLPPEDRLWRHPSEVRLVGSGPSPWPSAAPAQAPAQKSRPVWSVAVMAGVAGAFVAVAAVAFFTDGLRRVEREVVERVAVTPAYVDLADGSTGVTAIAQRVGPAVARIEVEGERTGCGVLFRDDGHLLTNGAVVGDAGRVTVVLAGGERHVGEVVGVDPDTDVAVVRIHVEDHPTAVLGTAVALRVGQPVVAVGPPTGLSGDPWVTTGVVSALGRRVERTEAGPLHDLVETDARVQPSSSGGALVDASGAVVGITAAVAVDGGPAVGFATPIDLARAVADDIVRTGHARHVWLGVEGTDHPDGALVTRVVGRSPADAAGLADGDVIVAVDGRPVATMSGLVVALRSHDPGDEAAVTYVRDGETGTVTLTLAEKPAG